MSDILKQIEAYKRDEIAHRKTIHSYDAIAQKAEQAPAPAGFLSALKRQTRTSNFALIAELKKASPSKGLIREDYDPKSLATAYESGGATCLSVLTDGPSFQGHEDDLVTVRQTVALPIIRKDFLYDPWQVIEARSLGADCILVILAAIDDATALSLILEAQNWGMDALVEVHNSQEMLRALNLPTPLIGINNRDLRSFQTDLAVFEDLAPMVGPEHFLIAESGIYTPDDAKRVYQAGAKGLLVGESLMRQDDVTKATRDLLA